MTRTNMLSTEILRFPRRERGSVFVWVVVLTTVMVGMASLVVDVGFIQREHARAQRACDAAALAGAKALPHQDLALLRSRDLAQFNGYTHNQDGITVTGQRNPDGLHPGWYRVEVSSPIDFFLAPILGYNSGVITVHATASYTSPLPMYICGSAGEYGILGIQNLSLFGPYAPFTYGDAYSVRWLNNGDPNPWYNDHGYDFILEIKDDYFARNGTNDLCIQIFDPDTWNLGNAQDAGLGKVDEIRSAPGWPHPQPSSKYTTTRFELYAPDDTPGDFDDDVLIAASTWEPGDNWSDMMWYTPEGWAFNLAVYGYGRYRINVRSLNGSSENGFNLRAGPPEACGMDEDDPEGGGWGVGNSQDHDWYPENGTEITAVGTLPINFNQSGTVEVDLGYVPAEAAGYVVYVNKFDTDVGAKSVQYYDEYGNTWPGALAGDGTFKQDVLDIPAGYGGSHLYAVYQAGSQDTSSWQLYFDGKLYDMPSELRLVD